MKIETGFKIATGIIAPFVIAGGVHSGIRQISKDSCSELSAAEKVKGNTAYELCVEMNGLQDILGITTIALCTVATGMTAFYIVKK